MKKVIHHRKKCIGCAYCVEIAPAFWRMNETDGKCDLLDSQQKKQCQELEIFEEDLDQNLKAVDICPAKCIKIQ